jgi:lipopolysaccharide export system permease protein
MTRLDRYLLRETAVPFVYSVAFSVLLVFLFQAQRLIGAAIGLGMTLADAGVIFTAALPPFLVLAVPIAYLLSVLVGLGRLATDRELVALRSAGASPLRIARAPLVLGLFVSLLAVPIAHLGEPIGLRVLYERLVDVGLRNVSQAIRPGIFNEDFAGIALYASKKDPRGGIEDVLLFDERDRTQPVLILAERGSLRPRDDKSVVIDLSHGEIHLGRGEATDRYERVRFDRASLGLDAEREVFERTRFVSDISKMTSREMIAEVTRRGPEDRYARRVEKAYWRRWAFPAMAFVFGVLGAAIALSARSEARARSAVIALLSLVGYYVLLRAGDWLVLQGSHTAIAAAWGPDLIVLAAAAIGLRRAGNPR